MKLSVAALLLFKAHKRKNTGAKFVIDSAFCTARFPFLIKSSQDYLTADDNLLTYEGELTDLAIKREATSMRQSSTPTERYSTI